MKTPSSSRVLDPIWASLAVLERRGEVLLSAGPMGWPGTSNRVHVGWRITRLWAYDDLRDARDVVGEIAERRGGDLAEEVHGLILSVGGSAVDLGQDAARQAAVHDRRGRYSEQTISHDWVDPNQDRW